MSVVAGGVGVGAGVRFEVDGTNCVVLLLLPVLQAVPVFPVRWSAGQTCHDRVLHSGQLLGICVCVRFCFFD